MVLLKYVLFHWSKSWGNSIHVGSPSKLHVSLRAFTIEIHFEYLPI